MVNEARRELQLEAIAALEKANYNGFVVLPTGSGKGWVLIECIKRLNPKGKIWYLCDSEDNRDTTFRNELINWGAEEWIDRIEFYCYQTACKLGESEGDVLLGDEADFALSPVYSQAFQHKFKHKILVSATLAGDKREMAKSIVPIVFERVIKEVEDAGILNGANHHMVNFMLNEFENAEYLKFNKRFADMLNNGKQNQKRLEMLQIERKHFMSNLSSAKNVCRKLIKDLYADEAKKILVFCGLSEQADAICKYSYHSKSEIDYLTPFDKGQIRVLTVVSKADRGLNINGVNNIIFESPTKSATKMVQRSGRGRRLSVDDILDIFYLVPYYKTKRGSIEPTIVKRWIYEATAKMNFNPIIYKFPS